MPTTTCNNLQSKRFTTHQYYNNPRINPSTVTPQHPLHNHHPTSTINLSTLHPTPTLSRRIASPTNSNTSSKHRSPNYTRTTIWHWIQRINSITPPLPALSYSAIMYILAILNNRHQSITTRCFRCSCYDVLSPQLFHPPHSHI